MNTSSTGLHAVEIMIAWSSSAVGRDGHSRVPEVRQSCAGQSVPTTPPVWRLMTNTSWNGVSPVLRRSRGATNYVKAVNTVAAETYPTGFTQGVHDHDLRSRCRTRDLLPEYRHRPSFKPSFTGAAFFGVRRHAILQDSSLPNNEVECGRNRTRIELCKLGLPLATQREQNERASWVKKIGVPATMKSAGDQAPGRRFHPRFQVCRAARAQRRQARPP